MIKVSSLCQDSDSSLLARPWMQEAQVPMSQFTIQDSWYVLCESVSSLGPVPFYAVTLPGTAEKKK